MLNSDYREMLSILNEERVDYLIVGAYAMAAHGVPRATGDIEIFVRAGVAAHDRIRLTEVPYTCPRNYHRGKHETEVMG